MDNQDSLTIKVLEKEYRVACPPEEKNDLQASAAALNEKLKEIKEKGSVIGTERIAVMAALNMGYDMLSNKAIVNEHAELNQRIDSLSEKIDSTMREMKLI